MPGRINALREPLLTLLMHVEIRLDRRNQVELLPHLTFVSGRPVIFSNFLVARKVDRTGDFDFAFGFTILEAARIGRP
jgi:hypothetical protein